MFFAHEKNASTADTSAVAASAAQATCFNEQFIRLQAGWEKLASTRSWVDTVNILGTGQKAAGYSGVSVGKPDLSQFGPGRYYPLTLGCIHPSIIPHAPLAWDSGADVVMEEFYKHTCFKCTTCGCRRVRQPCTTVHCSLAPAPGSRTLSRTATGTSDEPCDPSVRAKSSVDVATVTIEPLGPSPLAHALRSRESQRRPPCAGRA
eukprot:1749756-Prymnesium_polylepis.3